MSLKTLKKRASYYLSRCGDLVAFSFQRRVVAENCGHLTLLRGKVHVFGQNLHLRTTDRPEWCLKCREKMLILCGRAGCKKIIRLRKPVVLFLPKEGEELSPHAVRHKEDSRYVIGCCQPECAHPEDLRGYFWLAVPNGKEGFASKQSPVYTRAA